MSDGDSSAEPPPRAAARISLLPTKLCDICNCKVSKSGFMLHRRSCCVPVNIGILAMCFPIGYDGRDKPVHFIVGGLGEIERSHMVVALKAVPLIMSHGTVTVFL